MKIIHLKESFVTQCKIIPIGLTTPGHTHCDQARQQQNIAFFNLFAEAVEALIKELSENRVWFESPKIHIDHENKEILFGYTQLLTASLLRKIFFTPFTHQGKINLCFHNEYYNDFNQAICYAGKESTKNGNETNLHRLYFIETNIQALRARNVKAGEKCLEIPCKRHEERELRLTSVGLTRHNLFYSQQESEAEYFKKRFQQCDFLFYGEARHPDLGSTQLSSGHSYILEHIEALKNAGVTKVYSEYFFREQQPLIDYYFEAKDHPIPIELAEDAILAGGNSLALLQALKQNGIQLIGLEDASSVTGSHTSRLRIDSFNYRALKIIKKYYQPGEKSVVEVGGAHLFTSTSLHNLLNVEGFYPRFRQ